MPEWKIIRTWRKTEPLTLSIRKGSLAGINELCEDSPTLGAGQGIQGKAATCALQLPQLDTYLSQQARHLRVPSMLSKIRVTHA